jgi:putative FmdB family regulatory protein
MPLYTYECVKCGCEQEEIHGMMETPEIKCNKCNSPTQKIISGKGTFAVRFTTNDGMGYTSTANGS